MRKLKLFFACLLMAVLSIGQMWATSPDNYSFSSFTSAQTVIFTTTDGFGITLAKNNGSSNPAWSSNQARVYAKGSLTIDIPAASNYKITSITYTYVVNKNKSGVAPTINGVSGTDDAGTWDSNNKTWTASSTGATSVVFSTSGTAGNVGFTAVSITYTTGDNPGTQNPSISTNPVSAKYAVNATATALSVEASGTGTLHYQWKSNTTNSTEGATNVGTDAATFTPSTEDAGTMYYFCEVSDDNGSANSGIAEVKVLAPKTTMDEIFAAATDAGNTATDVAITFDNWVVTAVKGSNAYVTDGTKGFIIYGSDHGFVVGNVISGTAVCKVQLYKGAAELTNLTSSTTGLSVATGGTASVNELNAEGIAALSGVNTGSLIKISGECSLNNSKYYIAGVQLYNTLYSFSVTPGSEYECTGVYIYFKNGTADPVNEIAPRSADDIEESQAATLTEVDGLAELKAEAVNNTYLVNLTDAIVTLVDGNSAFIEDTNAGALIYFSGHNLVAGDKLNGQYEVTTATYNGKFEITAMTAQDGAQTIHNAEIPVTTLTIADLKDDDTFAANESRRIKIVGVNVTDAIGNSDRNGVISDGNNTFILYAGKSGVVAELNANIDAIGYPTYYVKDQANDHQLSVWAQADITVNVKEDPELAYDPEVINLTLDNLAAFTPAVLEYAEGFNGVTAITYESSNPSIATVGETTGVVEVVATAAGSAVITATFGGNAKYNIDDASYTINVADAPLTDYYEKVTSTANILEGTYLIVYEGVAALAFDGSLETLDASSNTIDVTIVEGNKIAVTDGTAASTFYIDPTAGTIKSASGKYIGQNSDANGLSASAQNAFTNTLSIEEENADIVSSGGAYLRYNATSGQERFRYYKSTSYTNQQPIALYKLHGEVVKPESGLAWDPAENIEITVGNDLPVRTLLNPNSIPTNEITITSSNTDLATINNGAVELVENATGTTTITASYTGDTYKTANVTYTITVNPVSEIVTDPESHLYFSTVVVNASVDAKTIGVELHNVASVSIALTENEAGVFAIDKSELSADGDISVSILTTATAGTYTAKVTISDNAAVDPAEDAVITLHLKVNEPEAPETDADLTANWVLVTSASQIAAGKKVIIAQYVDADGAINTMGEQKNNNRGVVASTVAGTKLTPAEGTKAMTLVAAGEGAFYMQTSNDKYLYNASTSGNSYLRSKLDQDASWTISVTAEGVATITSVENTNRTKMRYNENGTNPALFNCYANGQNDIALYVLTEDTPEPPVLNYTEVRNGLEIGRYYTICLEKNILGVKGATFWSMKYKKDAESIVYLIEETDNIASFEAGTPFIFRATAATLELAYGEATATDPYVSTESALRGTFEEMNQTAIDAAGTNLYMLYSNTLYPISNQSNNTILANRAYVDFSALEEIQTSNLAPGRRVVAMPFHKDTATGMDELNASEAPVKMIIDGQLFIIRGEKMFDATGRLVK